MKIQIHTSELIRAKYDLPVKTEVLLSGRVYTARDAAHKRITAMLGQNLALPFPLDGAVLYYAGPTPARPGAVCGSFGPTTSGRMDPYTPMLLEHGLMGMIGKGQRSREVVEAIRKSRAVYFCALGGAGALAAKSIVRCDEVAFPDLGCESVKCLELRDFPVYVGVDCFGHSMFS